MEIIELISYYIHEQTKMIEVSFRTNIDTEEEFRNDIISIKEAKDYGYELIQDDFDFFTDEDLDDEDLDDFLTIDEDNLISYLNEYYTVNPGKLPKKELL
jgi:hypothetical protein